MAARGFCCEICWRSPTCGNDCGSCEPSEDAELDSQNFVPDELRAFESRGFKRINRPKKDHPR